MLESKLSIAASATARAVPFPVDFKDQSDDRLYRQVVFPGTVGTYRIRAKGKNLKTLSTVIRRAVETGIPIENVDGKRFRIKAVLSESIDGVSESYWLTMHHQDYADLIQDHNQYRVRGVTKQGWYTDWVYSELRDRENRLEIFQLLHDILDLAAMVYDDELETFLTTLVQDSFHAILFQEGSPLYALGLDSLEQVEHYLQEQIKTTSNQAIPGVDEKFVARIEGMMQHISSKLHESFKEMLCTTINEDSNILKRYQRQDVFTQSLSDLAGLLVQHYLEEAIEKVVQSTKIEVFLDNEENQQIYLEGHYNFDIKGELLRHSYTLMPEDRFFLNATSTVQLIAEPVARESMDYQMISSLRQSLLLFKKLVSETLEVHPSEEISKFLRMIMKDLYVPHLIVDQRLAEITIDLDDTRDKVQVDDAVVEYDLESEDGIFRTLLVRDMVKTLLLNDVHLRRSYEIELIDELIRLVTDRTALYINNHWIEYFDCISLMGEQFAAHYNAIFADQKEDIAFDLQDETDLLPDFSPSKNEVLSLLNGEILNISPTLTQSLSDHLNMKLDDLLYIRPWTQKQMLDELTFESFDSVSGRLDLISSLYDYFDIGPEERIEKHFDLVSSPSEYLQMTFSRNVSPTYLPHPKDSYGRDKQESCDILMLSDIKDKYELNGKERVLYALGEMSDTGWPLGKFKIGTNTLKGGTS
jgi:hypothetical protein